MYKYIHGLDYKFIEDFARELGLKNVHVRHNAEGWHIIYDNEALWDYNVLITDFNVYGINNDFNERATKLYWAEMYKIYGKKYLKSLKSWLISTEEQKHLTKKKIIKDSIKKISEEKIK